MTTAIAALAELVQRQTGISLPPARGAALGSAVHRAAPGLDPAGFLAAASDPVRGPSLMNRLIDEVTVQETAFVRHRDQLDLVPWHSLHREAGSGGTGIIRAWSAGCATGEEAYTLALLASESFLPARAPVDVLGTDISAGALAAAEAGRYGERAVRGLGEPLRRRYLEHQPGGTYLVGGRLRGLVRFRRHNLARDPIPPPGEARFDLVVCRNVLIYFEAAVAARVIRLLERSLNPGGTLVLGGADALLRTSVLGATRDTPGRHQSGRGGGRDAAVRLPAAAARLGPAARPGATAAREPAAPGRGAAGGQQPTGPRERLLAAALEAAGKGDTTGALARVASLLTSDPLDADAHFLHGLVALEAGEAAGAAGALRRALYTDPTHTLAAFTLGRAYDALGDWTAARRAYAQALRTLDPGDRRHEPMLQQIDLKDIAAACRARLEGPA